MGNLRNFGGKFRNFVGNLRNLGENRRILGEIWGIFGSGGHFADAVCPSFPSPPTSGVRGGSEGGAVR